MAHELHIVVRCPECGERRVAPADVTIRHCLDDGSWSYRFTCPGCDRRTVNESAMADALVDAVEAGAGYEAWNLPMERPARPSGPPFTLVDVLDLHLLLREPDWFDQLVSCDHDADR